MPSDLESALNALKTAAGAAGGIATGLKRPSTPIPSASPTSAAPTSSALPAQFRPPSSGALGWAKEHPWHLAGAGAIAIGLVWLLVKRR